MYTINDLYDLTHTLAGDYLARFTYPWEALSDLADCIRALGAQLDSEYLPFGPEVWVHRTAHVAPTASITGPCIIGPETEVPLRLYPGQRAGGRPLRGGQLRGAEECHPVRQRADAPL